MLFFMSPFLAVQASFWPLFVSIVLFSTIVNTVLWIRAKIEFYLFIFSLVTLIVLIFLWWGDLNFESLVGYHTHKLEFSLRLRMLLFILSEVFFFIRFFWAFYDFSLAPSLELGLIWPPKGVFPLSVYSVPLLNTIILLSSGLTVTWAHHAIINNFFFKSLFRLGLTVGLGFYFLAMQWLEYDEAMFSISDGAFGSIFFVGTGFHGAHVIIGRFFLLKVLFYLLEGRLLHCHHSSFEFAAWYWHFVDVVWLFLFLNIYWWGGLCL